ncbi:hypothetical protein I7412_18500, partial [Frankia sp. CN6]
ATFFYNPPPAPPAGHLGAELCGHATEQETGPDAAVAVVDEEPEGIDPDLIDAMDVEDLIRMAREGVEP